MARQLTEKQLRFCELWAENPTMEGAIDAYSRVYSDKNSPETVKRAALRLMKNPLVERFMALVRDKAAERAGISLAEHLRRLDEVFRSAFEEKKYVPAILAEVNRGKASGLYEKKLKVEATVSVSDALERARERVRSGT